MAADPDQMRSFQRLDAGTTTSGRLVDADLAALQAMHVAHVINLAMADHPEAWADADAKLAAAGIAYTHVPVPFDAPSEAHYQAFCAALGAQPGPVHVHCIANFRVSAFFYRLHRERGMDEGSARALLHAQWAPELSDDPRAKVWAAFIAEGGAA
jgi:protein tyrosine phosphatase (PTP) superfamily phosphohydrolase (DUF442 family)